MAHKANALLNGRKRFRASVRPGYYGLALDAQYAKLRDIMSAKG